MGRTRLGVQDALWLTMDRPNSLMVIDTVMWFRDVPDWDKVRELVAERVVDRYPVFRRRPVNDRGVWFWEDDPGFDLAEHVVGVTLERDDPHGLAEFVASQRSVPFDRARPMWSMFCIDNVAFADSSHGAAVMGRFHHSIADGVRLVQVALGMCDLVGDGSVTPVGRRLRRSHTPPQVAASAVRQLSRGAVDVVLSAAETTTDVVTSSIDTAVDLASGEVGRAARTVAGSAGAVLRRTSRTMRRPERLVDIADLVSSPDNRVVNDVASVGKLALSGPSARTVWSGTPGVAKGASFAPTISLEEVKAIRQATATTVNDVLLAAVSGALTRYLREHGEDSLDEVLWMVPVSVTPTETELPEDLGNHFALVLFRMPVGIDDVRDRLAAVHERMERIKSSDEALITFGLQRGIAQAPSRLATALTNYFANKAVGVLTNVPGPRQPMTLAGAEVDGVLGWAPCSGDQPLTICILSYNGKVSVGFGTDATLVPDGDRLGELFAEEFADMHDSIVGGLP